jgi:hypothetical protein
MAFPFAFCSISSFPVHLIPAQAQRQFILGSGRHTLCSDRRCSQLSRVRLQTLLVVSLILRQRCFEDCRQVERLQSLQRPLRCRSCSKEGCCFRRTIRGRPTQRSTEPAQQSDARRTIRCRDGLQKPTVTEGGLAVPQPKMVDCRLRSTNSRALSGWPAFANKASMASSQTR